MNIHKIKPTIGASAKAIMARAVVTGAFVIPHDYTDR